MHGSRRWNQAAWRLAAAVAAWTLAGSVMPTRPAGGAPAVPPAASTSRPAGTQPASAAAADKFDRDRAGTYTSGKWKYQYEANRAYRGERVYWGGPLWYDGKPVMLPPRPQRDHIQTPWGVLRWLTTSRSEVGSLWVPADETPGDDRLCPSPPLWLFEAASAPASAPSAAERDRAAQEELKRRLQEEMRRRSQGQ